MPNRTPGRLFWPVLLILVGILLLLNQFGIWQLHWPDLLRLWPVLLILLGLDLLLSRARLGGLVFIPVAIVVLIVAVLLVNPFAPSPGDLERRTFREAKAGIERADLFIEVPVGKVTIAALETDDDLLRADVRHDPRRTEVTLSGTVDKGHARVYLRGSGADWTPFAPELVDEWEIGLAPDVPFDLHINGGANDARIDLYRLTVAGLDIDMGVGSMDLVLGQGPYTGSVDGGIGKMVIVVPEGVEARVRVDGGIGSIDVAPRFQQQGLYHVTEGYASAERPVELDVEGGIGSVTIR